MTVDEIENRKKVAAAFMALQAAVRQRKAELAAAGVEVEPTGADGDELAARLADLRQREFVQEPRPVSSRPGLGQLIVFTRKVVYHLFGKWHARAVLQQQNEFNQSAAELVVGLVERQRELRRELERLRARVERLEGSGGREAWRETGA